MKQRKLTKNKNYLKSLQLPEPPTVSTCYKGQVFDMTLHAWFSKFTGWLSPAAFGLALYDWIAHLNISPARRLDLLSDAQHKSLQWLLYALQFPLADTCHEPCDTNRPTDKRFNNKLWEAAPFNFYSQGFLLIEQWWDDATSRIRGVSQHHSDVVNFTVRQTLDLFAPTNFILTNPEVLQATFLSAGNNFVNGFNNYLTDFSRQAFNLPSSEAEHFKPGVEVAITPGKVIYRNHLIELIQYSPTTATVSADPILIVPAWIMKYYILDLSSHNSLVKYLVGKGHTVFMISWRNPNSEDRHLGFEEYIDLGVMSALEVINEIVPKRQIQTVGYCLGGTLLMITAAALAHKGDERIKSITLFAAQVDFKEAGELLLFMDESQISYIEDIMWEEGYLDGAQMSGAFSMLHSNELVWSRMIRDYLLGARRPLNDLMAWDADTTRLPFRMHSQYLRSLFLNNDLAQGRFKVWRRKVALIDIDIPIFAVGTMTDHISPWQSVYKVNLFTETDFTFVLTSGGHNAGIVSEPGHKSRFYHMATTSQGERYISADHWQELAPRYEGSWWPAWQKWLVELSPDKVAPPTMGNEKKGYPELADAPGVYVLQK
ncbi:alpha/beta fold hydrolase [soil metagenome]